MKFRDYTFLGTTQSLCPECLALVPAKIIDRGGRVYFRKRCPTHGVREDFVCSDVKWFDRNEFLTPAKAAGPRWRSSRSAAARSTAACAPSTSSTRAWACSRSRRRAIWNARCATPPARRAACTCRMTTVAGRSITWSRPRAGPRCCSSPAASRRSIPSFWKSSSTPAASRSTS